MISNPILTVGVPCYNEEKFLSKTLDSILKQSFKNFVVYVCDDCSTDNSLKIANEYSHLDSRIVVLFANRRTNFVENWNRSLEAS
jgi:glycosyltransferase involved in cell wall biosynthesis